MAAWTRPKLLKKSRTCKINFCSVNLSCEFACEMKFSKTMHFSAYDFTCEIMELNSILIPVGAALTMFFYFCEIFVEKFFLQIFRAGQWTNEYPLPIAKSTTSSACSQGNSHSCTPACLR